MYQFTQKIKQISKTKTLRQSSVTLLGTALNGIIGVFFYILVARMLGPREYGIFSFVTVTVALLASIANAGTDTGITKFVAENWESNKPRALRFMNAGLILKIVGFSIVLIGGLLLTNFVSQFILQKGELSDPFRWALVGVGGSMLFSFGCAALQSLQKFWAWSIVNVFGNSFRLIVFFLLVMAGFSPISAAISLFIFSPFLALLVSFAYLPNFLSASAKRVEFVELFHFNKWVAATTVIVAISTRLDSLYSTRFLPFEQVGYYSVAISLVGFISQIVLALGTVAAPKFATFNSKRDAWRYFRKLELFVLGLSLVGIPTGILISRFVVPLVYGEQYISSIAPLNVLIVSYSIFLLSMPIHTMILYFYGNSRFFFWLSLFHIACIAPLAWFLISQFGIMGAAYSVTIGMLIDFVIPLIYVYRKTS